MNQRGNALVEVGVLLPVYVLLLVGLIYFGNEVLLWQEVSQAARFTATNVQGTPGGATAATIARTNGPGVTQDYFLYFQGSKVLDTNEAVATFTQAQIHDELVKASWTVTQTFSLDGSSVQTAVKTGPGMVIYPDGSYAYDGDDALIAQEFSNWITRASSSLQLTYDSNLIRALRLPAGTVNAQAESVLRRGTEKSRATTGSDPGGIGLAQDLIQRFGASETPAGSVPMPHYPDFMPTLDFWAPN